MANVSRRRDLTADEVQEATRLRAALPSSRRHDWQSPEGHTFAVWLRDIIADGYPQVRAAELAGITPASLRNVLRGLAADSADGMR
jgi:hypothetical protein